jgi:hypothetical protein
MLNTWLCEDVQIARRFQERIHKFALGYHRKYIKRQPNDHRSILSAASSMSQFAGAAMWGLGQLCEDWGYVLTHSLTQSYFSDGGGAESSSLRTQEIGTKLCGDWGRFVGTGADLWGLGQICEDWGRFVRTGADLWGLGQLCGDWGRFVRLGQLCGDWSKLLFTYAENRN